MSLLLTKQLEDMSEIIRKKLHIPNDIILCSADLGLIISRIHEHFPEFEITEGQEMSFRLKDKHFITITYDNTIDIDNQFDFVIHSFCYGILLDKETLQNQELGNFIVGEDTVMYDKYANYLATGVLLPKEQFFHDIVSGSQIDLEHNSSSEPKIINKKYKALYPYSGYNY